MLIMPRMRSAIDFADRKGLYRWTTRLAAVAATASQSAVECQHQLAEPDAAVCVLSDPTSTVLVSCLIG